MPLWADALAPRPPRPPSELLLGVIDAARTRKCSARRLGGLDRVCGAEQPIFFVPLAQVKTTFVVRGAPEVAERRPPVPEAAQPGRRGFRSRSWTSIRPSTTQANDLPPGAFPGRLGSTSLSTHPPCGAQMGRGDGLRRPPPAPPARAGCGDAPGVQHRWAAGLLARCACSRLVHKCRCCAAGGEGRLGAGERRGLVVRRRWGCRRVPAGLALGLGECCGRERHGRAALKACRWTDAQFWTIWCPLAPLTASLSSHTLDLACERPQHLLIMILSTSDITLPS